MFGKSTKNNTSNNLQPDALLENAEKDFKQWRDSAKDSWQIPDELWNQVISLLPHYSKQKIANVLSLKIKQINQQIKLREEMLSDNNLNEDGNFVEVPVEKSFKEHLEIQHQITIIKPNGMILKLPKPHHDDMADLMVKFCKV